MDLEEFLNLIDPVHVNEPKELNKVGPRESLFEKSPQEYQVIKLYTPPIYYPPPCLFQNFFAANFCQKK